MRARPCLAYGLMLLIVALLGTLVIAARVPWLQGAVYSDFIVAHAPQVAFVRRAVAAWGQVPLWSPVYNAGYPLYANPLATPAYPPGWLAYGWPVPWGLNLAVLLHLAWAAVGWGCWMRRRSVSGWAWWGLAAALLPKTLTHGLGGHVTLLYALAWVPWLLLSSEAVPRWRRWGPGLVLGLLTLADPRATPLVLPLLAVTTWPGRAAWRDWARDGLRWGVTAGFVAAPLLLPLALFALHSPRHTMSVAARTAFSLPWGLLGDVFLAYPRTPSPEYRLYVPWAVGLLALRSGREGRRGLLLAALAAMLAVGRQGPGFWLSLLPGWNWLRVPARWGWLVGWGLIWAAAQARPSASGARARRLWLALGGLGLGLRGVAWPLLAPADALGPPYWLALAADGVAWWRLRPGVAMRSPRALGWLALVAALAFSAGYARLRPVAVLEQDDARRAAAVQSWSGATAQPWAARWAGPRVYSPSYSIGQWTAARLGLPLAYGVDPLYTTAWAHWLTTAARVPWVGYTVTLPPLEGPDPQQANAPYRADARRLAQARVAFLVAAFPHEGAGWQPRGRVAGAWVYANTVPVCSVAWVAPVGQTHCGVNSRPARLVRWEPNRVLLAAQGPGWLVLSENRYPTWRVWVDGRPAASRVTDTPWRVVPLSPGAHRVEWRLWPWDLGVGWALALGAVLFMLCDVRCFSSVPQEARP